MKRQSVISGYDTSRLKWFNRTLATKLRKIHEKKLNGDKHFYHN